MSSKSNFINGQWIEGAGASFISINPATNATIWEGTAASGTQVHEAIGAARNAFGAWAFTPLEERIAYLEAFRVQLEGRKEELIECISQEMGRPLWDTRGELGAMIGKLGISIESFHQRTGTSSKKVPQGTSVTRHKPHGVVAVFGPYNFPAHLPNGHLVPALLAGNTAVFKPSELTPLVAQKTLECWEAAGLPPGVINLVQGERDTGIALAGHDDINGLFFTGSSATGNLLHRQFGGKPEKLLALELGGNNPMVIDEVSDLEAAAYTAVQSSFLSSGQRCTSSRRLIVPHGEQGDALIQRVVEIAKGLTVGPYTDSPEPFMGPLVSNATAQSLLEAQKRLLEQGGNSLLEMRLLHEGKPFVSPGIVDVTAIPMAEREDVEYFGPFLQVVRVDSFEEAIEEANRTAFGLSSALLSDSEERYQQFFQHVDAGIVNWNGPTNGASSNMPFGGVGASGNHFPSAFYAADYCSYPVASIQSETLTMPAQISPGVTL